MKHRVEVNLLFIHSPDRPHEIIKFVGNYGRLQNCSYRPIRMRLDAIRDTEHVPIVCHVRSCMETPSFFSSHIWVIFVWCCFCLLHSQSTERACLFEHNRRAHTNVDIILYIGFIFQTPCVHIYSYPMSMCECVRAAGQIKRGILTHGDMGSVMDWGKQISLYSGSPSVFIHPPTTTHMSRRYHTDPS